MPHYLDRYDGMEEELFEQLFVNEFLSRLGPQSHSSLPFFVCKFKHLWRKMNPRFLGPQIYSKGSPSVKITVIAPCTALTIDGYRKLLSNNQCCQSIVLVSFS